MITYDRPLRDAESRDYRQITATKNTPEDFNDQTNNTFNIGKS